MRFDQRGVGLRDVHDLIRRFDQRKKPTVKLGYTQEAGNPRAAILVSLDARGPDGAATEVRAINATGSFIGAGVRVQVRYDRPARAAIECIVSDLSLDDRNAWEPSWDVLAGTDPVIGSDGELTGRYQIINGRFFFDIGLVGGPATVWGSSTNTWLFTLPNGIDVSNPTATGMRRYGRCQWLAIDDSTGNEYGGFAAVDNAGVNWIICFTQGSTSQFSGTLSATVPFTWDDPDKLYITGDFALEGQ